MDYQRIMMKKNRKHIIYFFLLSSIASCASIPKNFPAKYYKTHEQEIIQIEKIFNQINKTTSFTVSFTEKTFNYVNVELKTDSLRYIYEFNLSENNLSDTLYKYGYDTTLAISLIKKMQRIKCTWINKLDYYIDNNKQSLVYMSIRASTLTLPFESKKYYILAFYKQPQYYDAEGRLLQKRNRKTLRKINYEIFWRINDKVCYTVSSSFR